MKVSSDLEQEITLFVLFFLARSLKLLSFLFHITTLLYYYPFFFEVKRKEFRIEFG